MFFLAAVVLDAEDNPSPASKELVRHHDTAPRSVANQAVTAIFALGAATLSLGTRILLLGATAWAGLFVLRGAFSIVGLKRLPASTETPA